MSTPKPKLRWYQYRLRTFLLFGLVVSLGLSWYAVRTRAARTEAEAIVRIQAAGGFVFYGHDSVGRYVREVVFAPETFVTDADLKHLQALKRLERLEITSSPITDAGLKYLEGLKSLKTLKLMDISITDAGLQHLEGLKSLRELTLEDNGITDAGLKHLEGLGRLERVTLYEGRITDAGLKHLEKLPVRLLFLGNRQITGAELDRFPQLEWLRLCYCPFTDASLKRLEALAHLRKLDLGYTHVTDAGLKDLKLSSLRELQLNRSLQGTVGVREFREAHPDCYVGYPW